MFSEQRISMNKRGFQVNDSVREAVAWMWTSWNEALSKYTTRTGIPLPPVLTHKGLPIPKSSLVASMCRWVEEGHQRNSRAGVPEYRLQWKRVLSGSRRLTCCGTATRTFPILAYIGCLRGQRESGLSIRCWKVSMTATQPHNFDKPDWQGARKQS